MKDTVARIMEATLSRELDRKDAALYMAYQRLEEAGCLRFCLDEKQPDDQRRYCIITDVGGKRRRQGRKSRRKNKKTHILREG